MKVTTSTTAAFRTGVLALSKCFSALATQLESLVNEADRTSDSDRLDDPTIISARGTRPAEPDRVPRNPPNRIV